MGKLMKNEMNAINATLAQTITDIQALRPTVEDMRYELTHIFGATDSASGSVASFSDGAGGVFAKNVKVNITPSQSGSGDPSPTNIRPISGYTQAVVTNTGSGKTFSATVDFPTTIYGGTLNLTTGELVSTMAMENLGSLSWLMSSNSGYGQFFYSSISGKATGTTNVLSDRYKTNERGNWTADTDYAIAGNSGSSQIYIKDSRYSSASTFKTAMSGIYVCYELATPATYQLTPKQLLQFTLDNNISANCGTVEVTYRLNLNTAIERLQGA